MWSSTYGDAIRALAFAAAAYDVSYLRSAFHRHPLFPARLLARSPLFTEFVNDFIRVPQSSDVTGGVGALKMQEWKMQKWKNQE